jgi:hypothetical protein
MAIQYDISGLLGKTENEGSTDKGRLTAAEFNTLVSAVGEVQNKVEGTIKGIKYNGGAEGGGQTFSNIDEDGFLTMMIADSSGTEFTMEWDKPPRFIARGSECPVRIRVNSKQIEGENKIPSSRQCTAEIKINGVVVASGKLYDKAYGDPNNKEYYDPTKVTEFVFDLSTAKGASLITGDVENIIDISANNGFGKIKEDSASVNVIELGLTVNSFGVENVYTDSKKPSLIVTVTGTDAKVNAYVDGVEILKNGSASNGAMTNFGEAPFTNVNTHGVHELEVYAHVTKTAGGVEFPISTEPIKYTYIYGTTSTYPVVMSVISNTSPEEYSTLTVSYIAYKYNSAATSQTDTVYVNLCEIDGYDVNGNPIPGNELFEDPITSRVVFDAVTKSGSGSAAISLFPIVKDNAQISLSGKRLVKLSIGEYVQYTEIEVIKSSVNLTQLTGYAVYLSSNSKNNDSREWISTGIDKAGNRLVTEVEFDKNIEWSTAGSGFNLDSDGNIAMHLRKGRFFTLKYAPFSENPTYNDQTNGGTGRGKTISFEIATRNCLKNDSPVVSCMDSSNGSERGFLITASEAILKSNNFGLSAKFRENTRIKIDFVIEGVQTAYSFRTRSGKNATGWDTGTSNEALAIIYVDGVYQGLKVIPASTTFIQGNSTVDPQFIKFGSYDCDLDVYNIRIYDQALTPAQIVNNYSYDTPKFEDKLAIARRNDIFDATSVGNKPNINMEKLRRARPDLPFWIVKMDPVLYPPDPDVEKDQEVLPVDKEKWMNMVLTEWKNPMNENDPDEGAVSFTTDSGKFRNQGTSSMSYPWPWRNWDWKTDKKQGANGGKFVFGDGSKDSRWNQYSGMPEGLKKITLKKDYASSEMCNNAMTSEFYTDMALGIGSDYPNVLSPAMRSLGINTPYRMTFKAIPCFMFQEWNDPNKQGTAGKGYDALGMMNLIANKNECGHLGFESPYTWEECRAQSWELADNMDDWFWYKKLTGINRNTDGTFTNDTVECYEARYPKDSTLNKQDDGSFKWNSADTEADFGNTPEKTPTITNDQYMAIYDEQKDIIEFHNWLVDCNRQIPIEYFEEHGEYRKLEGNEYNATWNTERAVPYTEDTPEYRLDKFAAEAEARLIIDQFCMYYVWREQFWAFDSGFKNLQVYTMGPNPALGESNTIMQWGCMVRDADTTLGIENTGKSIFPPHLEDTDYYTADVDAEGNAVSNVKFVYDGAKGLYHNKSIAAKPGTGHAVLNGQLGSLWINLRDAFGSRIGIIYKALAGASALTNWNATAAIKRFRDHQEKWCENLYNFGMRQYFGGGPFTKWIESGLGDKKNSRASWLERGFYYRNSKYNNLSDYCAVRGVCYETPDLPDQHTRKQALDLKAYIPFYFASGAHEQVMGSCQNIMRITDTDRTFQVIPGKYADNTGKLNVGFDFGDTEGDDTVSWFFGTDNIVELGDLARSCKWKMIQYMNFPKLRELNLGHEKERTTLCGKTITPVEYKEYYTVEDEHGNTTKEQRPLSNSYLDAIDCSSLTQLEVLDITNHSALKSLTDFTNCTQLKELYARGTDALTNIAFPNSTTLSTVYLGKNLTGLNLTNLTGITKFNLEGAEKFERFYVDNCGTYMASRTYDLMKMSIAALEKSYDPKTNNNICKFTGIDWNGAEESYIKRLLDINATLEGKINLKSLSNDLKVRLVAAYGNIDDSNNSLYITYQQRQIDSAKMPTKTYIHTAGKHQLSFSVTPSNANTYASAEWSIDSNPFAYFANETDAANGIITRNSDEADHSTSATITVRIKQLPRADGRPREDIVLNGTMYFYERIAKPGDYVFPDGSYSDEIIDETIQPIGVCFYVDPNEPKENRLMVALDNISLNSSSMEWGLGNGGTYESGTHWGSAQQVFIESDPSYDCYDIAGMSNLKEMGPPEIQGAIYYEDQYYRDANASANDYFKTYQRSECFGDIGWKTSDKEIYIDDVTMPDGTKGYITVDVGDRVPTGYYNTLSIIEHRNKILNEYYSIDDNSFRRPEELRYGNVVERSELADLKELCSSASKLSHAERTNGGNVTTNGHHLYFPAASACFAYEPNASGLLDKFKVHNWFLPSSGELVRICYYMYQSYKDGKPQESPVNSNFGSSYNNPANAFYIPLRDKKLMTTNFVGSTVMSSTEGVRTQNMVVGTSTGKCTSNSKGSSYNVRPICRF